MSWPVAAAVAVLAIGAAAVLLALVPHLVLNHLSALEREGRVALVTLYEPVAFVAVAWGAMRVQRRGQR
jgi:hypothetical protein